MSAVPGASQRLPMLACTPFLELEQSLCPLRLRLHSVLLVHEDLLVLSTLFGELSGRKEAEELVGEGRRAVEHVALHTGQIELCVARAARGM